MHDVIIDVMVITPCNLHTSRNFGSFWGGIHALTASSHGQWQGNVMITNNA